MGTAVDIEACYYSCVHCRENTPLSSVFSNDFWGSPLTHPESHKSYRPLTILSFRLNRNLHELSPWGYHLFNVLAHAAVCVLFTYFSISLLASPTTGLLAGLLFTLHPIHTEAVSVLLCSSMHAHTHARTHSLTDMHACRAVSMNIILYGCMQCKLNKYVYIMTCVYELQWYACMVAVIIAVITLGTTIKWLPYIAAKTISIGSYQV